MAKGIQKISALKAHENRYNRDLAWLLKRLGEVDAIVESMNRNIYDVLNLIDQLIGQKNGKSRSAPSIYQARTRGKCRIIRFPATIATFSKARRNENENC